MSERKGDKRKVGGWGVEKKGKREREVKVEGREREVKVEGKGGDERKLN